MNKLFGKSIFKYLVNQYLNICKRVKTDKERKILENLKHDILFDEDFNPNFNP